MTLREKLGGLGVLVLAGVAVTVAMLAGPFVQVAYAADSDGDGVPDDVETAVGTDPNDSDSDNDGWSDGKELFETGTDPNNNDSDGDTVLDNVDSAPLNGATGSAGTSTVNGSYAENLTAACWNGTSAMDAKGFYPHSGEFTHGMTLLRIVECNETLAA